MRGWGQGRSSIMNERLRPGSILYYEWRGWGRGWFSIMNERLRLGLGSGSVIYNERGAGARAGELEVGVGSWIFLYTRCIFHLHRLLVYDCKAYKSTSIDQNM